MSASGRWVADTIRDEAEDPSPASGDFNLERFILAQDRTGTYERALGELRDGRKTSHWMRFVFPRISGLGNSEMSRKFAISTCEEAGAYLQHPVLGLRLMECTLTVLLYQGLDADDIFGDIDAQKLHSSMTLFMRAAPEVVAFARVLDQFFEGRSDPATDRLLRH
jgi:uncharacterized protein (DUF1810 family)